jgi:DNA-binding NtrC family response regulator
MTESPIASARLLVVDDDEEHGATLVRLFRREGVTAVHATSAEAAWERLSGEPFDLVLSDLVMPGGSGIDLLRDMQKARLGIDVVLMTAFGTVEVAVDAMRAGAFDFVVKPIKRATLLKAVERAISVRRLRDENTRLREQLDLVRSGPTLQGSAPAFRRALEVAELAARSDATVLLRGESGTGKELFARHIHDRSRRAGGPFVPVHAAALQDSLVESELFGHEAGAFTGASQRKPGLLELADGGTLFLDEVGEIPLSVQVKLLRFIQLGEVQRVGATQARIVDVRLVAATHRDLEEMVREGEFRGDLYFRLNVVRVDLPPLRQRVEDIPQLAQRCVAVLAARADRPRPALTAEALSRLSGWPWPGNVRELENCLERAMVLDQDGRIDVDDLPEALQEPRTEAELRFEVGTPLEEVERRMILATLAQTGGDKAAAAAMLGVGRRTIYRKLEEYGRLEAGDWGASFPERE